MNVEAMLNDGLYLMIVGMGFVISFLSILVILLYLMEKFVPIEQPEPKTTLNTEQPNAALTAVISSAIHEHFSQHRK